MTKKTKKRTHKKVVLNLAPKIVTTLILVGAIIILALLYQFTPVGKAIENTFLAETPQTFAEGPIDMDKYYSGDVNLVTIPNWKFTLTTSDSTLPKGFSFNSKIVEGTEENISLIQYHISGWPPASSLLSNQHPSSGDIYLDNDAIPDLKLLYADGYINIINPNYVAPEIANITILDPETNQIITTKIIHAEKDQPLKLIFNVTSTKTPQVNATWKDNTLLTESEFYVNATATNYITLALDWTPTEETAYLLKVTAAVDDETTTKNYIIAVGNVIYALLEDGHPEVIVKELPEDLWQTAFSFNAKENVLQPFSLPCGEIDLAAETTFANQIDTIKTYNQFIQQWKKGIPSEFASLNINHGYFLDLKDESQATNFTFTCDANIPLEGVPLSFPTIKSGWNLIAINGIESVPLSKLSLPGNKQITDLYSTIYGQAIKEDPLNFELEPGKAYWLRVN